ncbi:MAG: MBL fold metallo-hydrolase [Defluviitaleaceae bacterium]|nr:MBL fold metallo-hydrolase [Defluviitaleaceae bacterium]
MKIANNIAVLPIVREDAGTLHPVLAWDENNLVLIDAGLPGQTDIIVEAIAAAGHHATQLTHIILTHQDWDHVGCVRDLQKRAPSVKVVAHVLEAPYIDGRTLPIKLAKRLQEYETMTAEQRAGLDNWRNTYKNVPIRLDMQVNDGDVLPICRGIEIVHTPGHTPGHICLYFRKSCIMVIGDAAGIKDGEFTDFKPAFIHDIDEARVSIEKMKQYPMSGVVAYHSGYVKMKDSVNN